MTWQVWGSRWADDYWYMARRPLVLSVEDVSNSCDDPLDYNSSFIFTYVVQSKPYTSVYSPNPTDSCDVKTPFGWFVTRLNGSNSCGKWLHMHEQHSDAAVDGLKRHVHDETTAFTLKTTSDLRSRLASTLLSRFSKLALSREHFPIGIKPIKKLKANQCRLLNREGNNERPINS